MQLQLIFPTPQWEAQVLNYKEEFLSNNDVMAGTAGLQTAETFAQWYEAVCANTSEATVRPGLVPATTFLGVDTETGRLVGMIDIRHRLNDHLLTFGGHIGYSVRKSERRKGYAAVMLNLALEECKKLGLDRVLITCNKENIASAKTILHCGGRLENEVAEGDQTLQRY